MKNICSVDDCNKIVKAHGLCQTHAVRMKRHGSTNKPIRGSGKRKHPHYYNWGVNKQRKELCPEWHNDFWKFARDIGERPSSNHFLRKINKEELLSPKNFKWVEFNKRKPGETDQEWWARKWKSRVKNNPSLNKDFRGLKGTGLSWKERLQIGEEKLRAQNYLCAICNNAEGSDNPRFVKKPRLALDHCHKTGKLRGMLCWRCNTTLGKMEDSIPLIESMVAYLKKYQT